MSDVLLLFRTFVRTAEAGSFTAAAQSLHSSQPTISRQIAVLEDHLGCVLFQRTTRALALTDDGRTFYDHARRTLEAAAEAEGAVGRRKGKPTGVLRLACAGVFGRLHVIPRLARFRTRFPDVEVALHMSDGFTDLIEEGIDLAIRVGETRDTSLIARRIGTTRRVVVATPDYLARHGVPQTPADLAKHQCIVYDRLLAGASWAFAGPSGPISVPVAGPVHVNNTEAVRAAVLEGLGIGYVPVWHFVEGEIDTGRLVVLLREFEPPPMPINAVYPTRRFLAPKVRAAIDFFATELDLDPALRIADV
jgi:DNA-binding transcriptional LysR family regulator